MAIKILSMALKIVLAIAGLLSTAVAEDKIAFVFENVRHGARAP